MSLNGWRIVVNEFNLANITIGYVGFESGVKPSTYSVGIFVGTYEIHRKLSNRNSINYINCSIPYDEITLNKHVYKKTK